MDSLMLQSIWLPALAGLFCLILVRIKSIEGFLDIIRRFFMLFVSAYCVYLGWILLSADSTNVILGTVNLGNLSTIMLLRITKLSSLMIFFTGIFAFLISIFSMKYRSGASHNNWYYGLSLWTLASANAVFLAGDLFTLLIFWEISTLFLFGLIALGENKMSAFAAAKTLIILGLAEAGMLFAFVYIWITQGTLVISRLDLSLTSGTDIFLYFLIAASAMAKAGAMPFHSWIPTASQGAPTSVMAYLPASIDKLMGIFLLFMVSYNLFVFTATMKLVIMIIGVVTIIVAVFMAMLQHDLRKLLSYHAVSQVGYMVLGIGTGTAIGIIGGLFHMINHAIYKSGLFLCAGAVEKQTGITDLSKLGGLGKKMPLLFFSNIITAFAISGVIPLNGFISKWLVYQGCLMAHQPIMFILAIFGSALTLASFIKVLHSIYMGALPPELKNVKAPGFSLSFPPFVLALFCILFGIVPGIPLGKALVPALRASIPSIVKTLPAGTQFGMFHISIGSSYWQVGIGVVLLFLGVFIAWIYYAAGKALKSRRTHAFFGGIKPGTLVGYHTFTNEAVRVPGTGFYNTIKELPILKSILPDAEWGAFDPYRYVNKIGNALFVRPLKILHTGQLSIYLSWIVIGLVFILIYLRMYYVSMFAG